MKALALMLLICMAAFNASAFYPFPKHTNKTLIFKEAVKVNLLPVKQPAYLIPPYKTPKGAVFCRMEEKVTKASGIWLKLGVGIK